MRLAPEGHPFVAGGLLLTVAGWTAVALQVGGPISWALAVLLSVTTLFVVWFFRDPTYPSPPEGDRVVAPGEGRVIDISQVVETSFLGGAAHKISIFLSVFDVHVQRAPVSGIVEYRDYRPGKYAVAWLDKASEDNESSSVGIATRHGRVLVRQIAGLVARRIITDPEEGDRVERGERIGLIRFGSRVDLYLPRDWEVTCGAGDRTRVGSTVLARVPANVRA